jgi:hypothetical protein
LGRPVITGKNAYRIQFTDPQEEDWQGVLMGVLLKIKDIGAS